MENKILLEETTLRDGEQAPTVNYTIKEKIDIAEEIADILTEDDIMDVGFPIVSKSEFETIKQISKLIKKTNLSVISRMNTKDIELAYESLKYSQKRKIVLMTPTSPQHRKYKLKMSKQDIIDAAVKSVREAKEYFEQIEVGFEDGTRTENDFIYELMETLIKEGVDTFTMADTLGCMVPSEVAEMCEGIRNNVSNIDKVKVLGIHCHDDMGLALANSIEAMKHGFNKIGCAFNGLGERTGNVATEELLLLFMLKGDIIKNLNSTKYNYEKINECSKLVEKYSGINIQKTKAVVGDFCFLHESGIHQDGILKEKSTYQLFDPARVGFHGDIFSIGKHSGRNGLKHKLDIMGIDTENIDLNLYFKKFKEFVETNKKVDDKDFMNILQSL